MKISFMTVGILVLGIVAFPGAVKAQSRMNDSAAEIHKGTLQSQKLMEEYKNNKQKMEDDLQQKLRVLTNDPGDRARRRQWMEEANQKLSALKRKFSADMEVIHFTQRDLMDNPSTASGSKNKKKGFSGQELKEKIAKQEEMLQQEREEAAQEHMELPLEQTSVQDISEENKNAVIFQSDDGKTPESQDDGGRN